MTHDSILAVTYAPACLPADVAAWARKRELIIEALPRSFSGKTHDVVLYTKEVVDDRMMYPGPDEVVLFGSQPIIFRHTDNPEWDLALRMGEAALYLVNCLPMIGVIQDMSTLSKSTEAEADFTWGNTKNRSVGRLTGGQEPEVWSRLEPSPPSH